MSAPVILSYGLGVDSTAILLRWINEPASRDFELDELTVVTAMTGDEWQQTGRDVTAHVLPLLREHGIRYVQIARAGASQRDGITILDDSRSPEVLHLAGDYKLSDELLNAATVPQMGGARRCSAKAKGWPLDIAIESIVGKGVAFRHVIGYEANEPKRAEKDAAAGNSATRTGEYPLIEWGWDRAKCEEYITACTGVEWLKSACVYCPFALANKAGRERVLGLYRNHVDSAVDALFIERVSVLFNERQGLNGEVRLLDLIKADGNEAAVAGLKARLAESKFAVYRVRRVIRPTAADPTKVANISRSIRRITSGEQTLAEAVASNGGHVRRVMRDREAVLPAVEEVYVVAPAIVADKAEANFEAWWTEALAAVRAR